MVGQPSSAEKGELAEKELHCKSHSSGWIVTENETKTQDKPVVMAMEHTVSMCKINTLKVR